MLGWIEAGGPVVSVPTRRGFGTTPIERTLAHELDAEVRRDFTPGGLRGSIVIPFDNEIGRLVQAGSDGGTS